MICELIVLLRWNKPISYAGHFPEFLTICKPNLGPKTDSKILSRASRRRHTDHVTEWGAGGLSILAVLGLVEVAALVVHAAALELAEEVEKAGLIGGVAAQLLQPTHNTEVRGRNGRCSHMLPAVSPSLPVYRRRAGLVV